MTEEFDEDGCRIVKRLTRDEYRELERAMQWPEDLPAYDKLNRPISGSEIGSLI